MKISYAITVKDELSELQRLVDVLLKFKRPVDEIVILFDEANGSKKVEEYLRLHSVNGEYSWFGKRFENDFASWKNQLTELCSGDYIFQIDADEYPHQYLIESLPELLETNPDVELFYVPRINTVDGITEDHIKQWRWKLDENGWINFPDFQTRIYKKSSNIYWKNKVHEQITGVTIYSVIPDMESFCLYHPKTIERQEKQNTYYNTL
jgi:hypothetical protein